MQAILVSIAWRKMGAVAYGWHGAGTEERRRVQDCAITTQGHDKVDFLRVGSYEFEL